MDSLIDTSLLINKVGKDKRPCSHIEDEQCKLYDNVHLYMVILDRNGSRHSYCKFMRFT